MQLNKTHKSFDGETRFYSHKSEVTNTDMNFSVFVPQPGKKPSKCIIWLSGLTCTEENFMAKAGAQAMLSGGDTMIICPDTSPRGLDLPGENESYDFGSGAGFYVNATTEGYADYYQMYDYVNDEIYGLVQTEFEVPENKISIMGHSMGGHGALVIGLRNPKKYKSVSAFSPIVNPINSAWGQKALAGYLGDDTSNWKEYDACALLESGHVHSAPLLIEQGLADDFYPAELLTENIEASAKKANQDLILNKREGYDHSYYFIASFLKDHLDFHQSNLNS
ncbi:S-formylglutathione hydrolase [bacterium]|nr:S-formylglutathione hydrolase [bacterium]NCQ54747.1 S-formylglutathione hydrolase [Candidatus Parcubacteria bacterium]NCS68000.1 S-formylglutathione hydrolase [Candidatus Peregrinibacteria bacterium]NCS95737.1 S-formylglutathione hydrolase [bacterium]